MTVSLANRQRLVRVAAPWLERLVRRALAAEGVEQAEISILLVNDRQIGRLHEQWFGDPRPTDVITFPLSTRGDDMLAGDIVVSAETARRRGREFGWAAREELAYYVIHGLLHLTGHDDTTPAARRAMRARERAVMRAAGLAGDIVVSAETARRRGREFGWTPREELAYYVVHGLLHLTGHDDTTPAARRAMRARERAVMRAAGLAAPPRSPKRRPA